LNKKLKFNKNQIKTQSNQLNLQSYWRLKDCFASNPIIHSKMTLEWHGYTLVKRVYTTLCGLDWRQLTWSKMTWDVIKKDIHDLVLLFCRCYSAWVRFLLFIQRWHWSDMATRWWSGCIPRYVDWIGVNLHGVRWRGTLSRKDIRDLVLLLCHCYSAWVSSRIWFQLLVADQWRISARHRNNWLCRFFSPWLLQ